MQKCPPYRTGIKRHENTFQADRTELSEGAAELSALISASEQRLLVHPKRTLMYRALVPFTQTYNRYHQYAIYLSRVYVFVLKPPSRQTIHTTSRHIN